MDRMITSEELFKGTKQKPLKRTITTQELFKRTGQEPFIESRTPVLGGRQVIPESPVSIIGRLKMGFGNRKGNLDYLKGIYGEENVGEISPNKFTIRQNNKWYAVDPSRKYVKDIPKDIADMISEVPELIGMGKGAAMGALTPMGPLVGGIVGGAAGAVTGRATKMTIGKLFETYKAGPEEIQSELQGVAILGAAGSLISNVLGLAGRTIKASPQMTGISKKTLSRIVDRGTSTVLTPEKVVPEYLPNISEKVLPGLKYIEKITDNNYKTVINQIKEKVPNLLININVPLNKVKSDMVKKSIINSQGKAIFKTTLDPTARTKLKGFVEFIDKLKSKKGISIDNAIILKDDIWRISKQMPDLEKGIAKKFYGDLRNQILNDIRSQGAGAKLQFSLWKANKLKSEFHGFEEFLEPKLGRTLGLTKLSIESEPVNQIKILLQNPNGNRVLKSLDNKLPKDLKFYDNFLDGMAAEEVTNSTGIWAGIRKIITKEILTDFGRPIRFITKEIPEMVGRVPYAKPIISQITSPTGRGLAAYEALKLYNPPYTLQNPLLRRKNYK